MIYSFKCCNEVFLIQLDNNKLSSRIQELVMAYQPTTSQDVYARIIISEKCCYIYVLGRLIKKINSSISDRDCYLVFYYFLYTALLKKNIFGIHGAVVSKDNNAHLIVGNFGAGKTTLTKEFSNVGYNINSADQTFLVANDNKLYMAQGSARVVYNKATEILDYNECNKFIKISSIICVDGMANGGDIVIMQELDNFRKLKVLSQYLLWITINPLHNSFKFLKYRSRSVIANLSHAVTKTKQIKVRGDAKKIVQQLSNL